jgi:alkyl hydroperoxide reductase subunit D
MNIEALLAACPGYAKDLKLNLSSLLRQNELTPRQTWGTAVCSAIVSRNREVSEAILNEAAKHLTPDALEAAKSAAAVMGMNNVYYRFLHLTPNEKYRTIPARLRMNVIRTHGSDPADFELWCLAASAINGCGACVDSHERTVRAKGLTEETVTAAIRLASVIHAVAAVMDAEVSTAPHCSDPGPGAPASPAGS